MNKILIKGAFLAGFAVLLFLTVNLLPAQAQISCSGGNCWHTTCTQNSDCGPNQWTGAQRCQGNSVYQNYMTFTCRNAGSQDAYCERTITERRQTSCGGSQVCRYGFCMDGTDSSSSYTPPSYNIYNSCSPRAFRSCVGNSVYWFDSCNNRQDLYQTCSLNQVCSSGACTAASYTYHSLKGCENNIVYWYDSLGYRQDVYQNCPASGQTCQNGQCIGQIYYPQSTYNQSAPAPADYTKNYSIKCYNNNVYWVDSTGKIQDVYKNCSDDNQCTADSCLDGQCFNTLECDGSTCQNDSADYLKYCPAAAKESKETSAPAAVSQTSSFMGFIKRWYIWIIMTGLLVFLFVVIFRRLSSRV